MEDEITSGLQAVNAEIDARMDAGNYESALELAQHGLKLALSTLNSPDFMEGFAQWNIGRIIGAAVEHYAGQHDEGKLTSWAVRLPLGHGAAKRARDLLGPEFEPAERLCRLYDERAAQSSVFRTGQFTPEGLHDKYQALIAAGDAKRKNHDYLGAIEAYDAALAAMEEAGYENSDWEGIARYKIAQSIMNGCRHAAELAAGDYGPAGELRESQGDLMNRLNALAPRGFKEMQTAARLVPRDTAVQKGLALYQQWKSNLPWLFEEKSTSSGSQGARVTANSQETRTMPPPAAEPKADRGCFVATAVYGSAMVEEVQMLRDYRDRVLSRSSPGRALVLAYERLGPILANLIINRPRVKAIVRAVVLTPVLWVVRLTSSAREDLQ